MKNKPTVSAVIVAAGSGTRMGGVSKPLIDLGGKTVLERVLDAVSAAETVDDIVLVCRKSNEIDTIVSRCKKPIKTVEGGATRTESVRNGAMAVKSDFLCFHDCARPFIKSEDIDRVVNAALSCGAASACAPEYNTVKYLDTNRKVLFTPERDRLIAVQTPQVLKRDIYLISLAAALEKDIRSTDETTIAELAGFRVDYVDIGTYNFKLTDAADVKRAKAMIFLESRGML